MAIRFQALLSLHGSFYLVAVEQNRPKEIMRRMEDHGLTCEVKPAKLNRVETDVGCSDHLETQSRS